MLQIAADANASLQAYSLKIPSDGSSQSIHQVIMLLHVTSMNELQAHGSFLMTFMSLGKLVRDLCFG